MIREVCEEAGIVVDEASVQHLYEGAEYSRHGTHYSLYIAKLETTPDIAMSWEHASYEWIDRDTFLEKAGEANDTYMRLVHDVLKTAE